MRTPHRNANPGAQAGFTLLEILISLAVLSMLAGTMVPLATATIRGERIARAKQELADLADAAERYYADHGSFPGSLQLVGFYGKYYVVGIEDEALTDEWGGQPYRTAVQGDPDLWTVYSVGADGIDDGAGSEWLRIQVQGAKPGNARTRIRLAVIGAAVAGFIADGGAVTGSWSTDFAALGLDESYRRDGFGTEFRLSAGSYELRSAGPDRDFDTSDDLVL